ncbi:MAG: hypothetical protein ABF572_04750 [Gluconobacter sp.]|uniref:hypothetical protein n=1 Tax=Gluconobacter sp. TaxID=1876758 RepID=UPI0039ED26EC
MTKDERELLLATASAVNALLKKQAGEESIADQVMFEGIPDHLRTLLAKVCEATNQTPE